MTLAKVGHFISVQFITTVNKSEWSFNLFGHFTSFSIVVLIVSWIILTFHFVHVEIYNAIQLIDKTQGLTKMTI